ncbi:hypothetical protein J6590_051784 [Homalodisca vitripennis]|nr:hypothetical protein J6590_051784 [Homalodisca vitripennis]
MTLTKACLLCRLLYRLVLLDIPCPGGPVPDHLQQLPEFLQEEVWLCRRLRRRQQRSRFPADKAAFQRRASLIKFNGLYRNILQGDGRTAGYPRRCGIIHSFRLHILRSEKPVHPPPLPVGRQDPAHGDYVHMWLEVFSREASDDVGKIPSATHTEDAASISNLRPREAASPNNLDSATLNGSRNGRCIWSLS